MNDATATQPGDRPLPPLPDLELVLGFVRADAAAGRFGDWGRSTLIDEHTGVPSIDEALFDTLHEAAGISAAFPVGNAGLLHVYGYWFSTVLTPFGYKRDRWDDGVLATAFGLAPEAFHLAGEIAGDPGHSDTPLARVTRVALPALREPAAADPVATVVLGDRESRVVLHGGASTAPGALPAASGLPALIYGIAEPGSGRIQLITTFPFGGDQAELLRDFEAEPVPRWNAAAAS